MLALPDIPFAEIAVRLFSHAQSARAAASCGEVWAARYGAAGTGHAAAMLAEDAEIAGKLYQFFRDAAPHEDLIRDFLAGLAAGLPPKREDAAA